MRKDTTSALAAQRTDRGAPDGQVLDVSVVLPCLDEEATVGECVREALGWMSAAGLRGEVIVVDNGSRDRSAAVAETAGATVLRETVQGKSRACITGFNAARGRHIVLGDADGTYDLSDLTPLVAPLENGVDMVIGDRFAGPMERGAMPWSHRWLGNPVLSWLVRRVAGLNVNDCLSGLRAVRAEALNRLRLSAVGFELESEMIVQAARQGLRVVEVPVPYRHRRARSKLRPLRDGWRIVRFLVVCTPDYSLLLPGTLLFLVGLLALGVALFGPSGRLEVGELRWQPIFAAGILLPVATNALVLGLVARVYAMRHSLLPEDALGRLITSAANSRRGGIVAVALIFVGAAVDVELFLRWTIGYQGVGPVAGLASLAQACLLMGCNILLGVLLLSVLGTASHLPRRHSK